jgi:hypothetical protein
MDTLNLVPILISVAALALSLLSFWQTYWRRGSLLMTRPSLLFIGREGARNEPKIFLRALLFSAGTRGWILEQLFLRVHQGGGTYLFDLWAYGEAEKLSPGSGLFIGEKGVVYNHHFLRRTSNPDFLFLDGDYRVEVYARLFGERQPKRISEFSMLLRSDQAAELIQVADTAVFFEWNVDAEKYISRVERRPGSTENHASKRGNT